MEHKKKFLFAIAVIAVCVAAFCFQGFVYAGSGKETVTQGKNTYRGFQIDNVLHSQKNGDIHYHAYFPDSYDGKKKMALYVTLPGYQGLYFQGVAENLKTEEFAFEAQKYNDDMVILAPQPDDWGEMSANQTIALVEYFLGNYPIDAGKVYSNGYSGGGETLSLVLGKRPELFTRALMCSSQWDGTYEPVVKARTTVCFVIGESDEYYSSGPFRDAYKKLHDLYQKDGLSEQEIKNLLVLDVKDSSYFEETGVTYQHGGGSLFCRDKEIMGWLFANYSITLDKTAYTLKKGKIVQLKAVLNQEAKKKDVKWKSSNSKVASVSKNGKVMAKKNGKTVITARIKGTKVKAECRITVLSSASRAVTRDTTVSEVVRDPAFGDFGRLMFPVDRAVSGEPTLAGISNSSIYTWYSNIKAEKTVE